MTEPEGFNRTTKLVPKKILVIGGPRCGKTTHAKQLGSQYGISVLHLDDHMHLKWSEVSDAVVVWLDERDPWVMEGVQGVRGLRKWLRAHPDRPLDFEVHLLVAPKVELTKGQQAMYKACKTMFQEILPELEKRGAKVLELLS